MVDLKKFREENLKMTQKEFADMIGVRQDYISRTEQAVGNISLELLIKIAINITKGFFKGSLSSFYNRNVVIL